MKYLVQSVSKSETRNKKPFLRMTLLEQGGKSYPGVFWDPGSFECVAGEYIDALVEEGEYKGEKQLNIKAARVTGAASDDAFLPRTPYSIDGLYAELTEFVGGVVDENIRKLLAAAIEDERWKRAPAAQIIHHAYLGGLLEHTVNICRLAHAVAALYPVIRRDLLVAGAVLHDIGKMDEMNCATVVEYTTAGQLLGHTSIGFQRVTRLMDKLATPSVDAHGVSGGLRLLIEHIILSHHGNKMYGAPTEPQLLEAQVFSNLDGIDATMGSMLAAIAKTTPGKMWSDKVGFKQILFLGDQEVKK